MIATETFPLYFISNHLHSQANLLHVKIHLLGYHVSILLQSLQPPWPETLLSVFYFGRDNIGSTAIVIRVPLP